MALIASLLGGGSSILGSILQNNRMKDIIAMAQEDKAKGERGMESLLADRQTAYNNVWKMIYGGVENFDFSSMTASEISFGGGERSGNRQGATDTGVGGSGATAPHSDQPAQGKDDLVKNIDWYTQNRFLHESEM